MRTIYTIGSNKKTAEEFFGPLQESGVDTVSDIRLNNRSQLAGFTKEPNKEKSNYYGNKQINKRERR